jgi:hypothetical protein
MKINALILFLIFFYQTAVSQFVANYDEAKMPAYTLPDVLKTLSGKTIRNKKTWEKHARPELLAFFTENMFGRIPGKLTYSSAKIVESSDNAINGKANRRQVKLTFENEGKALTFNILIYLPKNVKKAPVFLGYNFLGNHSVHTDPAIIIPDAWASNREPLGIIHNRFTEKSRGAEASRWSIERMMDAGIGLATIYYGEIDPDKNDFTDGIHQLLYKKGQSEPDDNEWGSIAAWAWGLGRAMDYFENESEIDEKRVIVFGHSRLGKTSIWAGVSDKRFAGVISNNSGCGGAALSKRIFGETVGRINTSFPHWFCDNFNSYNENEQALPVDQHQLLALIAPRPVYVASAEEDLWADPKGEYLGAHFAMPVYNLYGIDGLKSETMPAVNSPVHGVVSYHIRTGKHDVTDYDWEQYIKWAKEYVF